MAFLQELKKKTGLFVLGRRIRKLTRNKAFINLADAGSIGIVLHQVDNDIFEVIQNFIRELINEGKKVKTVGYVDLKTIPDHFLLRKGVSFFCREELNWYSVPEADFIDQFINEEFDLLIDLSLINYFPVEYIFALSRARFKVSRFNEGNSHADLCIDIKSKTDISYLIQQLNHYLRQIKSNQNMKL